MFIVGGIVAPVRAIWCRSIMTQYTDTENTGTPTVPLLYSDDNAETMQELVWSHRLETRP